MASNFVGPLTSFSAPAHCSSALLSCSARKGTSMCTATYGLTCAPNGTPTPALDCYPNAKAFLASPFPTFSPGEACPTPYISVTESTYTSATRVSGPGGGSVSYYKATNVGCCPPDYPGSVGGCTSTIPETATVQYLCDLATPVPITVPYKKTGQVLWYAYITGTQANPIQTWVYEGAVAPRVEYVSGFVGTGPFPTATSSSYSYGGYSSGGSGSSSGDEDSASISLRKKTRTKIVVGVVVPVVVALVGAIALLFKKKKKDDGTGTAAPNANNHVESGPAAPVPAPTGNTISPSQPPVSQNTPIQSFFAPGAAAPPAYMAKQEEVVHGVHELRDNTEAGRTARIADLEAQSARVNAELTRAQQVNALEQEQARIQAELARLRNTEQRA